MATQQRRKRRPTVPFGEWRIALDLDGTRAIASAPALARGCECPWCRNWAEAWERVLPPEVARGLRRLGIDPADPADLYADGENPVATGYAVFYYCVGVVRDGPAPYYQDDTVPYSRDHQVYQELRGGPQWLSVLVAPQRLMHDFPFKPPFQDGIPDLVQVEFRLTVPWLLDEEHPSITRKRSDPKPRVIWKRGRLQPVLERRRSRWRVRAASNPI